VACSSQDLDFVPSDHITVPEIDAWVRSLTNRHHVGLSQRGHDKHLHYSRGVTVEEMRRRRWR